MNIKPSKLVLMQGAGFIAINAKIFMAQAEVSDKCPSIVSGWLDANGGFYFLSFGEALLRFLLFTCVYSFIAFALAYWIRRLRRPTLQYLPLVWAMLVCIFLIEDFVFKIGPCNTPDLLREMPIALGAIELAFSFVSLVSPVLAFLYARVSPDTKTSP